MKIIAVSVQKGGTGKTTTVYNVAAELAATGRRVLLVDIDPQATLTCFSGVEVEPGNDIASVFGDAKPGNKTILDIVQPFSEGIDIAPGSIDLAYTELTITGRLGRESILKKALTAAAPRYDVCIIDTPPSLGLLTINGLAAADSVLIPIQPTSADIRGLQLFLQTLQDMKEINPELSVMGILLTMYDKRLQLHRQAADELQAAGLPVLSCSVTRSVRIAESGGESVPLREYDPRNQNNDTYKAIAEMIIQTIQE